MSVPLYRLLWLEIAERQYLGLPEAARNLVDERLAQLEREPFRLSDAISDPSFDQWSAPAGGGLVLLCRRRRAAHRDRAAPRTPVGPVA